MYCCQTELQIRQITKQQWNKWNTLTFECQMLSSSLKQKGFFSLSLQRKCVRKDSENCSAALSFMCSIHVDVLEHLGKHNTFFLHSCLKKNRRVGQDRSKVKKFSIKGKFDLTLEQIIQSYSLYLQSNPESQIITLGIPMFKETCEIKQRRDRMTLQYKYQVINHPKVITLQARRSSQRAFSSS